MATENDTDEVMDSNTPTGARSLRDMITCAQQMDAVDVNDVLTLPDHLLKDYINELRRAKASATAENNMREVFISTLNKSWLPADFQEMIRKSCCEYRVRIPPEAQGEERMTTFEEYRAEVNKQRGRWQFVALKEPQPLLEGDKWDQNDFCVENGKVTLQPKVHGSTWWNPHTHISQYISTDLLKERLAVFSDNGWSRSTTEIDLTHVDGSMARLTLKHGIEFEVQGGQEVITHWCALLETILGDFNTFSPCRPGFLKG